MTDKKQRTMGRMRNLPRLGVPVLACLLAPAAARAATLQVGPGKTYSKPCDAIAAAQPNDTVAIDPGTYTDTCAIKTAGLTVMGVGGRPKIDLTGGTPSGQKGIYVIDADGVTLQNLELTGATISSGSGENGAGVRIEASNLTIRGCYIHDNQDGILGSPLMAGGTLLIESSEFAHNGMGSGCVDGNGCTHNLYIGANFAKVTFQYNYSHSLATDTPDKGHLFKSRAQQNFVLYNRFTGEGDTDSYEVEFPQGGLAVVVGNMIEKPPMSGNGSLVAYGLESLANADHRLFVVNNTLVNDKSGGTFFNSAAGAMVVAHNNFLIGTGTPWNGGALSADNVTSMAPMFVNQSGYDYHLQMGSPAIDKGVNPGSADAFSLTPTEEYLHPEGHVARLSDATIDAGAFEFGTNTMGQGGAGSTTSAQATTGAGNATVGTGSGTASTGSGTGGTGPLTPLGKSGCSCTVDADESSLSWAGLGAAGLGVLAMRRRRR